MEVAVVARNLIGSPTNCQQRPRRTQDAERDAIDITKVPAREPPGGTPNRGRIEAWNQPDESEGGRIDGALFGSVGAFNCFAKSRAC